MPHPSDSQPPRYDASMIKLVSARESVRTRPGMYIRETDPQKMLHQLLWHTVDGLLWHYRFLARSPSQIQITVQLESDGSASVASAGPAVSSVFLEQSVHLLEHELSDLVGKHPINLFVVNALSDHLSVTLRKPGNHWHVLLFEQGVLKLDEECSPPPTEDCDIRLRLWPDFTILEPGGFDCQATLELMHSSSNNDPFITITVIDARPHTA